jgi:hypothetical protein
MPPRSEQALSLRELEAFDPQAPDRGRERRFLCPLCGEDKPKNPSHRSLSLNTETGEWVCHRCQASGKIRERWEERSVADRGARARTELRRRVAVPPPEPPPTRDAEDTAWRKKLAGLVPLTGTPGADYVANRGVPFELARAARVRYHPAWEHWAKDPAGRWALQGTSRRIVFPVYAGDQTTLMGIQGRTVADGEIGPAKLSGGTISGGVFTTPGAWDAGTLAIVEAPLDALSLAAVEVPAAAVMGCNLPDWLPRALAFRRVLVGTDADTAGDHAAKEWTVALRALGARVERLRPEGFKDWNEWLQADPAGLRAFLEQRVRTPIDTGMQAAPVDPDPEAREDDAPPPLSPVEAIVREAMVETVALLRPAPAHVTETPVWVALEAALNEAAVTDDEGATREAADAYLRHARAECAPFHQQDSDEATPWDAETAAAIRWLETWTPPAEPFQLSAGVTVADPAHFVAMLRGDLAEGPNGPRARHGVVQNDTRRLRELFGGMEDGEEKGSD